MSPNLITVPGRLLGEPEVLYAQNRPAQQRGGSWNMVNSKFHAAGSLVRWSYMLVALPGYQDPIDQAGLSATVKKFGDLLTSRGIPVSAPTRPRKLPLNGLDDPQLDQILQQAAGSLDLLLIILPDTSKTPLYNRIKRCGDVKFGIHTVCVTGPKFVKERGQDQYFANVALKLNRTLGGNNQVVNSSRLGILTGDKTMVVGIDVTHPSPGSSSRAPSIAGMVANVDKSLGQWPAVLRVQMAARQEMVSDLTMMLKSRLRLWKDKGRHAHFPENIIVYRDGVSEGQYQKVVDEELPRLRKACEEMYSPADSKKGLPRFTVIIAGKRHHTRFYPVQEGEADKSANPKPGTVVDRGVTEARSWDFFLQSHAALQGTARPGHYFVVHDEVFRNHYKNLPDSPTDRLEELTQAMCYIYGRATKAVSICTPVYYADIVCERARCYLSNLFDDSPNPSAAPSLAGSSNEPAAAGNDDVQIHAKLKDSMFYI